MGNAKRGKFMDAVSDEHARTLMKRGLRCG
jgi:hypothetical protein